MCINMAMKIYINIVHFTMCYAIPNKATHKQQQNQKRLAKHTKKNDFFFKQYENNNDM